MNRTNVLMISCQFMPDVYGGAEKQCLRLMRQLQQQGTGVTLLTSTQTHTQTRGQTQPQTLTQPLQERFSIRRIYTGVAPDLLGRWLLFSLFWWLYASAWAWWRRAEFDVIHCHQGKFGAFVGCFIGRLTGLPVLIKIGNSEQHMDLLCLQRKKFVGKFMARYVLNANPLFVAITATIARNLQDFGCRRVVHIANGIDPHLTHSKTESGAPDSAGCKLFYHGRIEPIKRVEVLLDALALVRAERPNTTLHLVGDGDGLAAVRSRAEALGLSGAVVFHGRVEDPLALVARFDVFVNASEAEGLSNSLLEALLLEKALVSTPVSGASDVIIDNKNGCIAQGREAAALASATLAAITLYEQQPETVANISRELVATRFSMAVVASAYQTLYRELQQEGA